MELDRNLLKEFAQVTNDSNATQQTTYLRGTIVKNSGGKYVQLDGSSTATPIAEVVDVDEGDRVLVSIENHRATIIGNFSFPPSARKEQEALDKAGEAQNTATSADNKAKSASEKADTAINQSSIASASADEAKQQANDAINAANTASTNASEAKTLAGQASTEASEAKSLAASSQASSAEAQAEVNRLNGEVANAKEDINEALQDLEDQAGEITAIKESYATKVEVGNTKAELETTITKKVGELETTVSETYSTKTENVELEGRLQSQITQNAQGLASQVSKTEKLESDTTQAQKDVADALSKANAAQTAADNAQSTADAAQAAADLAKTNANTATEKANLAQNAADAAQAAADAADAAVQSAKTDLDEAKQNLENVTNRVGATESEIAEAQAKVDKAQQDVNDALADAAEANAAATKAQEAADKAQQDAETAQGAANTAQQKADNAQTAADNAQAAADKAQQDVAALTKRVTTAETTISQNSEKITLNANKTEEIGTKLDNLKIGGRNLILESDKWSSAGATSKGIASTVEDGVLKVVSDTGNENWHSFSRKNVINANLKEGDEFTFSIEIKSDDGNKLPSIYFKSGLGYYSMKGTLSSEYSTVYYTGTWKDTNSIAFHFGWAGAIGTYYIRKIKMEKGNKPTDWTPAPEDIENTLVNNYYNKTETDAKIEIESDRITSTVTRVETVENNAIVSSVEEFYLSVSPTILAGGSWSTSQPTWTEGMYIWRRNYVTKGDGTTSYQPSQNGVCITGNPGESADEPEITKSFDGDYITLHDSSNYKLMNLKVYGKTDQYIVSGKNKFDLTKVYTYFPTGEITTVINDTGITLTNAWGTCVFNEADTALLLQTNTDYICTATVKVIDKEDEVTKIDRSILYLAGPSADDRIKVLYHPDFFDWEKGQTYECVCPFTTPEDFSGYDLRACCYSSDSTFEITELMIRLATETDDTFELHGDNVSPSLEYPSDVLNIEGDITVNITSDAGEHSATFPLETDYLMEGSYLSDDGIHYTRRKLFLAVADMNNTETYPGWSGLTQLQTDYPNRNQLFSEVANYVSSVHGTNSEKISINTTSDGIIFFNDGSMTQSEYIAAYPDLIVEIEYEIPTEEIKSYTETQQVAWTEMQGLHTYNPNTLIESHTRITGEYYTIYKGDKGDDGESENLSEITDSLNARIDQAQSTIDQLSDMISHLITDSNGGSLMTQTPDGWTFNMSTVNDNLTAIKDAMANMESEHDDSNSALEKLTDLVNDVANKTAYITMSTDDNGDPCIELGKSDSLFKVRITNQAIDFLEGSTKIAYANNNTFYSEKIIVKNELQIGPGPGFVWRTRENGNMGLIYISE